MSYNHNTQTLSFRQPARVPRSWRGQVVTDLRPNRQESASARGVTRLPEGTLTEVFCQADSRDQLRLLVPTLAELSRRQKWVTFIAPPCLPNRHALANAGVDTRKILVVHTRTPEEYWQTLEQMLVNGRSSAVLAWPGPEFNDARRERLKAAAARGNTITFILRQLGAFRSAPESKAEPAPQPDTWQLSLAL